MSYNILVACSMLKFIKGCKKQLSYTDFFNEEKWSKIITSILFEWLYTVGFN